MSQRFFVETPIDGDSATLEGQEAQHLIKVMRVRIGDEVTLFDGSGSEFTARVSNVERTTVRLDQIVRHPIDRELPFGLQLSVALPKGDRQRWLVEKLTELGVTTLVPLITSRSSFRPESSTLLRLRRTVIESSKQCGRNRLMEIAEPQPWSDYVKSVSNSWLRFFAHPESDGGKAGIGQEMAGQSSVAVAIGPEGGLTDSEVEFARNAGWQGVHLGSRILRVETAAVAIAAAVVLKSK